jgi:gamma-glutamylputrescine oxidase
MSNSYWLQDGPPVHAPPSGPLNCDVVVIGGGLCGTSAALHLAQQGVDVILLEGRRVAQSASGRNAGFLLQGTAERYSRAAAIMGRDRARRIHAMSLDNHRLMAQTIAEEQIDCAYQRRGSLQLAGSALEETELLESAALLREDGFEANTLRRDQLPAALQHGGFSMGVHLPADGELHPARFVQGVAAAAVRHGARIFEDARVVHLDASCTGSVVAQTATAEVQAAIAIVATNARAGELLPYFIDKVDPVRGQMLATAPCEPLFDCPIYANHGYDYWRQDEKHRVILGGWRNIDPDGEVGHEESVRDEIQAKMVEFLRSMGVDVPITHRWAGIMGFSRDGLPMVGPVPDAAGALAGVGFTGHGFGFGFLAGQALAVQTLEGVHPVCTELDPRRFA